MILRGQPRAPGRALGTQEGAGGEEGVSFTGKRRDPGWVHQFGKGLGHHCNLVFDGGVDVDLDGFDAQPNLAAGSKAQVRHGGRGYCGNNGRRPVNLHSYPIMCGLQTNYGAGPDISWTARGLLSVHRNRLGSYDRKYRAGNVKVSGVQDATLIKF